MITLEKRSLKEDELLVVVSETKFFRDLAYVKPSLWRTFEDITVALIDGEFAGCCATEQRFGWRKIGPIAVLRKFQKMHVGATLLRHILKEREHEPFYFGTSNETVKEFAKQFPVVKAKSRWSLPLPVIVASFYYLVEYMSFRYLIEGLRKRITFGRGKYVFYISQPDKV